MRRTMRLTGPILLGVIIIALQNMPATARDLSAFQYPLQITSPNPAPFAPVPATLGRMQDLELTDQLVTDRIALLGSLTTDKDAITNPILLTGRSR